MITLSPTRCGVAMKDCMANGSKTWKLYVAACLIVFVHNLCPSCYLNIIHHSLFILILILYVDFCFHNPAASSGLARSGNYVMYLNAIIGIALVAHAIAAPEHAEKRQDVSQLLVLYAIHSEPPLLPNILTHLAARPRLESPFLPTLQPYSVWAPQQISLPALFPPLRSSQFS